MSLRSLSDQEILSSIHELTCRERSLTRAVLLHLNEIERRRLHLKLGYASMFDYCTSGLAYSSSAAARRIRTARCIARFPEVLALLESNEVNLSTVSQVSRVLTPENKDALLTQIRSKSQREVDAIVAEYEPRATIPQDRVRPLVVRVSAAVSASPAGASAAQLCGAAGALAGVNGAPFATDVDKATSDESDGIPNSYHCRSGSASRSSRSDEQTEQEGLRATTETRVLISFSASEAFMTKLEKIRSLAWHQLPANASLERVFELVMNYYFTRKDPVARIERRQKREEASCEKTEPCSRPVGARHVAATVRDKVFTRDQGRCTYVGTTGRRCGSMTALQIDHIEPVARGGAGTPGNLRLLCAYHNRLEAERILGLTPLAGTTLQSQAREIP
jgi:hypothetical protein